MLIVQELFIGTRETLVYISATAACLSVCVCVCLGGGGGGRDFKFFFVQGLEFSRLASMKTYVAQHFFQVSGPLFVT